MTARRDLYPPQMWLGKMEHDLAVVRLILKPEDIPTDVVCFHAQQTGEKALKTVLSAHGVVPERTHDVVALLDDALSLCPVLKDEITAITALNGYAVAVRYPYHTEVPSSEEARRAAEVAERVCAMAKECVEQAEKHRTASP